VHVPAPADVARRGTPGMALGATHFSTRQPERFWGWLKRVFTGARPAVEEN
jgi:hypothetical protein